ncbi:MAG: DUF3391 domain-containing protein [Nitrospirae bacterium YQR-1]
MKQKISVDELKVGMFLEDIDASWKQTPFLVHRFLIKSDEQIRKIKTAGITHVFIDPSKTTAKISVNVSEEIDKINFIKKEAILNVSGPVEMEEAVLFQKEAAADVAAELPYTKEDLDKYYNAINKFSHIDKTTLVKDTYIKFPLYVKKSLEIVPLIAFNNKDLLITDELLNTEGDFLIDRNDKNKYQGYLQELLDLVSPSVSKEVLRNIVLREESKMLMEEFLMDPRSGEKIKGCRRNIEMITNSMRENNSLTNGLFTINKSDYYTYTHCINVSVLAVGIALNLGIDKEDEIFALAMGGMLHDIGKSKIPNSILNKPTKLTDDEFKIMKAHVVLGQKLLSFHKDIPANTVYALSEHHEKMTGKGYPNGLRAADIHFAGKVVTMADVYDALTTARPYKKALGTFEALSIVRSQLEDYDKEIFFNFVKMLGK